MRDLEYIWSKFDQVIPMVSHIEVSLPEKNIDPNKIGEAIKGPHNKTLKEALFLKYDKNKSSNLFWLLYQSNTSLMEQRSSVHLFIQVSSNATVTMHGVLL